MPSRYVSPVVSVADIMLLPLNIFDESAAASVEKPAVNMLSFLAGLRKQMLLLDCSEMLHVGL